MTDIDPFGEEPWPSDPWLISTLDRPSVPMSSEDGLIGTVWYAWLDEGELGGDDRAQAHYMRALQHDPCAYCGESPDCLDHVTARDSGGEDEWWNLIAACKRCNSGKQARTLLSFLGARRYRPEWRATAEAYRTMPEAKSRWNMVGR